MGTLESGILQIRLPRLRIVATIKMESRTYLELVNNEEQKTDQRVPKVCDDELAMFHLSLVDA